MFTPKEFPGAPLGAFGANARRNQTFGAYFDRFPLNEIEAVQLGRGAFDHCSLEIWGQNSILVRDRLTPLASFTMVPQPDWMMFLWPHAWAGDFRVNGRISRQRDVFCLPAEREWFTSGAKRDTLSLAVKRSVLLAACADLKGVDVVDVPSGNHIIANNRDCGVLLQGIYVGMLGAARAFGTIKGRLVMPPAHEADMICALAACLEVSPEKEVVRRAGQVNSSSVVKVAHEALREIDSAHLSMSDLCRLAGVGRTRLHQSFVDVYGVSPGHYLKQHRLSCARERLLDPADPARSVKEVALTLGFSTSGRFARDYHDMFGELPSETLARATDRL